MKPPRREFDEIALVTGAARRIGRVIALGAARAGYAVAIHHRRSRDEAASLQREIEAAGGRAAIISADLSDADACAALMREAAVALGPVTLLVNSAAIFEPDDALDFTTESFNRHVDINLRAPLILAREMAKALPRDRTGAIVNILDQRVFKPTPHFLSYSLAKSALHAATHSLAQAFAPGIRVNAVAPGPTLSNVRQAPEDFAKQAAGSVLESAVTPEEIADAVLYLAQARSITGETISVDGGQRLAWRTPDVVGVRE